MYVGLYVCMYTRNKHSTVFVLLTISRAAIVRRPCTLASRQTTSTSRFTHNNHDMRVVSQQLVTRKPRAELYVHQHRTTAMTTRRDRDRAAQSNRSSNYSSCSNSRKKCFVFRLDFGYSSI